MDLAEVGIAAGLGELDLTAVANLGHLVQGAVGGVEAVVALRVRPVAGMHRVGGPAGDLEGDRPAGLDGGVGRVPLVLRGAVDGDLVRGGLGGGRAAGGEDQRGPDQGDGDGQEKEAGQAAGGGEGMGCVALLSGSGGLKPNPRSVVRLGGGIVASATQVGGLSTPPASPSGCSTLGSRPVPTWPVGWWPAPDLSGEWSFTDSYGHGTFMGRADRRGRVRPAGRPPPRLGWTRTCSPSGRSTPTGRCRPGAATGTTSPAGQAGPGGAGRRAAPRLDRQPPLQLPQVLPARPGGAAAGVARRRLGDGGRGRPPAPPGEARPSPCGCRWPAAARPARTPAPTGATTATTPSRQGPGPGASTTPLPLLVTLSPCGAVVHNPRVDRAGGSGGHCRRLRGDGRDPGAATGQRDRGPLRERRGAFDDAGQCVATPSDCEIGGSSDGGQPGGGSGGTTSTTNGSSTTTSTTSGGP